MFLHTINKVNDNFIADFEHGVNHKDLNRHILLETIHLVHHNMFRKTNVSYPLIHISKCEYQKVR